MGAGTYAHQSRLACTRVYVPDDFVNFFSTLEEPLKSFTQLLTVDVHDHLETTEVHVVFIVI